MESITVNSIKNYDYVVNQFWSGMSDEDVFKLTGKNPVTIGRVTQSQLQYNHEIEINMKYTYVRGYKGEIPSQWVSNLKWQGSLKGKTVGIHAGCYGGVWEKKQWPHFNELVGLLLIEGYSIYLFGQEKESLKLSRNHESGKNGFFDYTDIPLNQTLDFISTCDFFIANDSGLMHIADAIGVPTIAIFGPTLPVKNRPVGKHSLTIQATEGAYPSCVPCLYTPVFQECKKQVCLDNISAGFVFEQFEKHRSELNG